VTSAPTVDLPARLDRHLREVVAVGAPASVLAVIVDGETVLACHGDPPPAEDTTFEIGSVTKTFTALLLAELTRTGEVRLDDPISAHLPPHAVPTDPRAESITLEQLATHCSGLPGLPANFDIPTDPVQLSNPYASYHLDDLYQATAAVELVTAPGAQIEYSNFGVGLLAQLLVNAAGQDYVELIRERVCLPLGLTDTNGRPRSDTAGGHDEHGRPTPPFEIPGLVGSGVLRSSPADLLRYLCALLDPESTPLAESLTMVQTPRKTVEGRESIGLAWKHRRFRFGDLVFHSGGTPGFTTFLGFCPNAGIGLLALRNATIGPTSPVIQSTYDLLKALAREQAGQGAP
jgi:CubicO group peptidase (beta-lactamase class C family)